jgi:phosphomethylpyrimidine synthase
MNVLIAGGRTTLSAGPGAPVRVMALVGMNSTTGFDAQAAKVDALAAMTEGPDLIADLSLVPSRNPLWRRVLDVGLPAAALPIYTVMPSEGRIDRAALLDRALELIEGGVGLLTIHPTPTPTLVEMAKRRRVPWTSRGGGLVIGDLLARGATENAYRAILQDLVPAARARGTVLSLGASFRAATIFDAADRVQLAEIDAQIRLARELSAEGVGVVIESPGHARPTDIHKLSAILSASTFPVMPLGPMPTDAGLDCDHVAAAIGATIMGLDGAAHVLAAVTREEHTGGIPSLASTIEAIRAARVAAHVIDLECIGATELDEYISSERAAHRTCVHDRARPGCSRCARACPL